MSKRFLLSKTHIRCQNTSAYTVTAQADDYEDTICIRRVDEPNPDYIFIRRAPVTNWFDDGELDETCFSINDTLTEIRENSKAGALIDEMMARGADEESIHQINRILPGIKK